jgi:hypothetical protein
MIKMKRKNRHLIIVLFSIVAVACNMTTTKNDPIVLADTTYITAVSKDSTISKSTSVFDLTTFKRLTDSLLTSITGKNLQLTSSCDTLSENEASFGSRLYSSDKCIVKRYLFSPDKKYKMGKLRFKLFAATYPDSSETNKMFSKMRTVAYKLDTALHDKSPGLTYTNDYVIKTDKHIYWLNTGCSFAYFNHKKIKQFMLLSLPTDKIIDSINCKCGQSICADE